MDAETIKNAAAKCESKREFRQKFPQEHKGALRLRMVNKLFPDSDPPNITKSEAIAAAYKYSTRSAFAKGARRIYNAARIMGWLDEICGHMNKPSSGPAPKWTEEAILAEAARIGNYQKFREFSRSAYVQASRMGILAKVKEACA